MKTVKINTVKSNPNNPRISELYDRVKRLSA